MAKERDRVFYICIYIYSTRRGTRVGRRTRGGVTREEWPSEKSSERRRRKYEARKEKKRREHAETRLNLRPGASAVKYREPRRSG